MDHYSGTYVNGVVMPDTPLPVPEHTRVEFVVSTNTPDDSFDLERSKRVAALNRLLTRIAENPIEGGVPHYTRDELNDRN